MHHRLGSALPSNKTMSGMQVSTFHGVKIYNLSSGELPALPVLGWCPLLKRPRSHEYAASLGFLLLSAVPVLLVATGEIYRCDGTTGLSTLLQQNRWSLSAAVWQPRLALHDCCANSSLRSSRAC